jgi:asparagine synthase (glutamine-hydrolysing)
MQYLDLKTYLSDDIFHKTDRASMFSSLETRAPFLDLNVVNSAWSLKTNEKVNFKNGKLPLRKILDKYYSKELFDRPKQGFGIPIDIWLRGKLKDWSYDLVFNSNINNYKNININIDLYKDLWQSIMDGKNNGLKLWPYLILSQWMKNYLNK